VGAKARKALVTTPSTPRHCFFVALPENGSDAEESDVPELGDDDGEDRERRWVAVRLNEVSNTVTSTVVTIPTGPHRRALHEHALACQAAYDFGAVKDGMLRNWLDAVTPEDSPPNTQ